MGQNWVMHGSCMGHMWVTVMLKGPWVMWVLWVMWATGQANLCEMAFGATRLYNMVIMDYNPV